MNKFKVVDEIYGQTFELIINCTYKEVKRYINKLHPIKLDEFSEGNAQFISFSKRDAKTDMKDYVNFLWIEEFDWHISDVAIVTHELQHLVFNHFNRISMKHNVETDEAYAYYYQYLFTKIYEQLSKWDVQRRKTTRTNKGSKTLEKPKKPVSSSDAPLYSRPKKRSKKRRGGVAEKRKKRNTKS